VEIVHLEAGRHLYGGARQTAYLIRELAARGVANTAICTEGSGLGATLRAVSGVEVVEWPIAGDLDWRLGRRLEAWLRARGPDLVHVHSRRGADTFGGRAARAAGIPAILTRRVQSAEPAWLLGLKCRPYAAVVAISTAIRDDLGARARLGGKPLELISSAVDTGVFRPDSSARARLLERYGLPADAVLAGCAAQLIPRKGHDLLLPLVERLAPGMPRFRLLLFGQGGARGRLERRVAALGLADRIRFCGFVADWPQLAPGLDLLLHPARREGLGSVLLEAMAAGVPVVASSVGGIVDVIADGRQGCLLAPDALDDWAAAVRRLAGDPAERARLATAARRRVERDFTIATMTDRYLGLYRDVAD
jgi:glycosyltransferase involved in cell wall biosynthesis